MPKRSGKKLKKRKKNYFMITDLKILFFKPFLVHRCVKYLIFIINLLCNTLFKNSVMICVGMLIISPLTVQTRGGGGSIQFWKEASRRASPGE